MGGAGTQLPAPQPTLASQPGAVIGAAAQRAIVNNPAAAKRVFAAGINHAANGSAAGKDGQAPQLNAGHVALAAKAFSASAPPKPSSPPGAQRGPDAKLVPQKVSSGRLVYQPLFAKRICLRLHHLIIVSSC